MTSRWATFDCYGTLVDWNGGVGTELSRLFGEPNPDQLLARYHEIEPRFQQAQPAPTRELHDLTGLAEVLDELVPPPEK
jgi:FMN phosphatase YigB (HAD superfamily)